MKCSNCGAALDGDSAFCKFCGTRNQPPAPGARTPPSRDELFAQLEASEAFARSKRPETVAARAVVRKALPRGCLIAGIVWTVAFVVAIATIGLLDSIVPKPEQNALFAMGTAGVLFGGALTIGVALQRSRSGVFLPETCAAVVVGRRQALAGRRQHQRLENRLLVELRDGTRMEYTVADPGLFATTADGDAGIFYIVWGGIVAFDCVRRREA